MTQIIPYKKQDSKNNGVIEYLILRKPSTSAILETLLMASFITATILPFINTEAVTGSDNGITKTENTNNN